jgi:hypothetical protein
MQCLKMRRAEIHPTQNIFFFLFPTTPREVGQIHRAEFTHAVFGAFRNVVEQLGVLKLQEAAAPRQPSQRLCREFVHRRDGACGHALEQSLTEEISKGLWGMLIRGVRGLVLEAQRGKRPDRHGLMGNFSEFRTDFGPTI